jgi:hypothetical protein
MLRQWASSKCANTLKCLQAKLFKQHSHTAAHRPSLAASQPLQPYSPRLEPHSQSSSVTSRDHSRLLRL